MTAPSVTIANELDTEGVGSIGSDAGWGVYSGHEPSTPDDVITIYDTGGIGPGCLPSNSFRPTIQARVRSTSYTSGYDKIKSVATTIKSMGLVQVGGIMHIGKDSNDRWLFTTNFEYMTDI